MPKLKADDTAVATIKWRGSVVKLTVQGSRWSQVQKRLAEVILKSGTVKP